LVVDGAAAGAGQLAAEIAAVVSERGLGGDDVDLTARLDAWRRDRARRASEARQMAKRWSTLSPSAADGGDLSPGALLALAYPDRIARNRGSGTGAFLLANGRGANVDASALAREPLLAVAELAGTAAQGRILLAASITFAEIEVLFADRIEARDEIVFDAASFSLRGRRVRRLGAVVLAEQAIQVVAGPESAQALAAGILRLGLDRLPWSKGLTQWRDRVMFLCQVEGEEWPDLSDTALAAEPSWLVGALAGKTTLAELTADELASAVTGLLPWNLRRRIEAEAPTHFVAPTGSRVPIDYAAPEGPKISVRVQELFGLERHPAIAGGRVPLIAELLSPAHRPVQVTRDLPGFWRGSYQAVKAEMKGRYPRHPWPDNPLQAPPTRRAKPRGT
jgi:ATP-dependent helicase HrpB